MISFLALSIGLVAGLRAFTAAAVTSWAAYLGWLDVTQSPLAFLGRLPVAIVLTLLAIAELWLEQRSPVVDRKAPVRICARISAGALAGGAIGASGGMLVSGALLGGVGAAVGTIVGVVGRAQVAAYFDDDRTAGFLEDLLALSAAFVIVVHVA